MFTVTGTYQGRMYQARWVEATEETGQAEVETTLPEVEVLLIAHEGESYGVTPQGPFLALDVADGASVLAALAELTDVSEVGGDVPEVDLGEAPDDALH